MRARTQRLTRSNPDPKSDKRPEPGKERYQALRDRATSSTVEGRTTGTVGPLKNVAPRTRGFVLDIIAPKGSSGSNLAWLDYATVVLDFLVTRGGC